MKDFVEQRIIAAVRLLLEGRVNEILSEAEFAIPAVELDACAGGCVAAPVISLSTCERSEKERLLKIDAYSLSVIFAVPESRESELHCYAYAAAFEKALGEDATLGGVAERAVLTGKKYLPPKKARCGAEWEIVLNVRITVEGFSNAG